MPPRLILFLPALAMAGCASVGPQAQPPSKIRDIGVVFIAAAIPYHCKDDPQPPCSVTVTYRERNASDPATDTNGRPIECIATLENNPVYTFKNKPLFFELQPDSTAPPSTKTFRFVNEGLWFSSGTLPPADEVKHDGVVAGGKRSMWKGGNRATATGQGYDFLPWVGYRDASGWHVCHARDPKIANED